MFAAELLLAVGLGLGAQAGPVAASGLDVAPQRVDIGLTYRGVTLALRGRLQGGDGAVVRMLGPAAPLELKRKGRVAGFLWMNVADADFDDVPAFYYVVATSSLREMAPDDELVSWRLGYDAALGDAVPDDWSRGQVVKLKQRDGLYRVIEGGLSRSPEGGTGPFDVNGTLDLPARLPPGTWRIELLSARRGRIEAVSQTTVTIEPGESVSLLRNLAFQHGGAYGGGAVVIAIVAGLLTGVVFQSKGRGGH